MAVRPIPAPRRLLAKLRDLMARGAASLPDLVRLVAAEMVSEVCSIYALRPGDILELIATEGLKAEAVGRTRLRVGEGIVGIVAATGQVLNLPDAQNHPAFAYRPETGEEPYASLLAVPVRRAGRALGVLAVQNRASRRYTDDEVEVLETVAMVLAEVLAASGVHDGAEESLAAAMQRRFAGVRLAGGIAIGPVVLHGTGQAPKHLLADDPEAELARLSEAVKRMQHGLDELIASAAPDEDAGDDGQKQEAVATREVLEAYRLVANEGGWLRRVRDAVAGGLTAEAAVHRAAGEMRDRMRRIADPYLRERLADLEDLAGRVLIELDGGQRAPVPPGAILVARRLGAAELLEWHSRGIAGVAIEEGSVAGHAAIVARALGLPALGGLRGVLEALEEADEAVLDADDGELILRPEAEARLAYTRAVEGRRARQAEWAVLRDRPAETRDGVALSLMLNVGLPLELDQLENTAASGIGLFRTEIAMLARGRVLGVPEQADLYDRVLTAAGDRPVHFRTLDLGGDKLLPDAPALEEENPAMGWRSLRVGLDRPVLLRRQLRAMLMGARGRTLSVMFPMVATVAEFRAARALLLAEVARAPVPPAALRVGSMLEVPALMWQLPALLAEADFVSVGSNDLMQFLFAADRASPLLADRYDVLSPPVLDLLQQLRDAAAAAGKPVAICGEAASRPLEALVLAALGYTTLSMAAASLPAVKSLLAAADLAAFRSVLGSVRAGAVQGTSVREPLLAWAREHGLPL